MKAIHFSNCPIELVGGIYALEIKIGQLIVDVLIRRTKTDD